MQCKKEYAELKGLNEPYLDKYDKSKLKKIGKKSIKNFLNNVLKGCMKICCCNSLSNYTEIEAAEKARSIIRKQCNLRGMPYWSWI